LEKDNDGGNGEANNVCREIESDAEEKTQNGGMRRATRASRSKVQRDTQEIIQNGV